MKFMKIMKMGRHRLVTFRHFRDFRDFKGVFKPLFVSFASFDSPVMTRSPGSFGNQHHG